MVQSNIPMSACLIGKSGDGKNYLAKHLIDMSKRRDQPRPEMTFSSVARPEDVEVPLFGSGAFTGAVGNYYVFNMETGNFVRNLVNPKNSALKENEFVLATIGMISHADHGTIVLNELGNAHSSMQRELLRFLDDRVVKPHLCSQYIPTKRPYDVWVIFTMQPKHNPLMEDLDTRLDKMRKIKIPSLDQRSEDILPLAAYTLDKLQNRKPEELFRPDALDWLKNRAYTLPVRTFTSLIRKLKFESSIGHYNVIELERAYSKLKDQPSDEQAQPTVLDATTATIENAPNQFTEREHRSNIEFPLLHYRIEMVKSLISSLEREKNKRSGKPEYPTTLFTLTGERTSSRNDKDKGGLSPIQCHRKLGDIIFSVSDNDIVQLIKVSRSKVFIQAVIQLSRKIDTAKKRLNSILNSPEISSDKALVALIEEANSAVTRQTETYGKRRGKKIIT
jgi:hypothetical protein